MWARGSSRLHYTFLGDVIIFDTTYRINMYDMPFGLFVGVNNHFQSTILAGVLVCDEIAKSFEWVFTEFLRMMGDDPPVTILIGKFVTYCHVIAAYVEIFNRQESNHRKLKFRLRFMQTRTKPWS